MDITLERITALAEEKKKREGCSDMQMERDMELPIHAFNKWATGQSRSYAKKHHLNTLADYFGVSIAYLIGETDIKNPAPNSRDGLSDFDVSLLDFIHTLSADQLRGILLVLRAPAELLSALDREAPQG